jgi:ssDNA-binding replication factor A large subunit
MQKNKEQLYQEIKDLKTKKEFTEEINKLKKEYDELLDDDAAGLLIIDELGRNKINICKITNLEEDTECTVFGIITDINPLKNFNRKNGTKGKVINLEISDNTGKCGLALWDKDVELVTKNTIKIGTKIKVINGYIKNGFNGIEINVGHWGFIEIEPEIKLESRKQTEEKLILEGKLVEIDPTKAFFKDNGEIGFVTKIMVKTEEATQQIIIWDQKVKEIQKVKNGDCLKIENLDIKMCNNKKEFHLNSKGIIKKL